MGIAIRAQVHIAMHRVQVPGVLRFVLCTLNSDSELHAAHNKGGALAVKVYKYLGSVARLPGATMGAATVVAFLCNNRVQVAQRVNLWSRL